MRTPGYARMTKDTPFPYCGRGIYFRGRIIWYSSVNLEQKAAFVRFRNILENRAYRQMVHSKTFYPNKLALEHLQEIRETFTKYHKGI